MRLTLSSILFTAGLTLFASACVKETRVIINQESDKTVSLENLVVTNPSKERITLKQHKKDIKKLVNWHERVVKNCYNGKSFDNYGNLLELIIPLDEKKFESYLKWRDFLSRILKAVNNREEGKKLIELGKEYDEKFPGLELPLFNPLGPLKGSDLALIGYDSNNDVLHTKTMTKDKKILYGDAGADGMKRFTGDFVIIINKDSEKEYKKTRYNFEGPILGKEKEWEQITTKLVSWYMVNMHNLAKILKKIDSSKYGFLARF